jgi:outer membrane receptor for ferrienterochelin and colicins
MITLPPPRFPPWPAVVAALAALSTTPSPAQTGGLVGLVRDSATTRALEDVTVTVLRGGQAAGQTSTDATGRFAFESLEPGPYELSMTHIGYRAKQAGPFLVLAGQSVATIVHLVAQPFLIDPVIVSASRTEQKALDAPASVSVVAEEAVEERPALTVIDHIHGVPGVDIATLGLTQHEVVARGFSNVASGALLTLTDDRYASLPSLRINAFNFIPQTSEDIARIEVVRGPGAALYGPNAANGVLHVITESPLDDAGTTFSLAGGERSLLQATLRHAPSNDGTTGFKVSAQYLRGDDWPFEDPTEVSNRAVAIAQGADPDTLLIGARLRQTEKLSVDGRLDLRSGLLGDVSAAIGINGAAQSIELTPLGAAQVRGWRYSYGQLRIARGRLFGQIFLNESDGGDTYLLRTGQRIEDDSQMLVGQLQHGLTVAGRYDFTYGVDVQHTVPRTGGTITGRNEDDDTVDEIGAYLHGETTLATGVGVVAAVRLDNHNRLSDPVVSPRAAILWTPRESESIRVTYNRAFSTPTTNNLFLDLFADSIRAPTGRALPFAIRVSGVPETGYTFRRDCGGPCMRSPFTPASLGGPEAYVPVDATLLWQGIVDTLRAAGLDLSGIPAPAPGQVETRILLLDGLTGERNPLDSLTDIPPLRPAITNTLELGYRGVIGNRVRVTADLYRSRIENFVGPLKIETPNAFFDSTSLANYLARFMPAETARTLAGLAQQLPVGTVSPVQARDPWDLLITYRNFGSVTLWGAEVDVAVLVTPELTVRGTYSWASDDLFPNLGGIADVALNAAASRGAFAASFRQRGGAWHAEVRGRTQAAYPVNSGVYVGTVDDFFALDALAGVRLRSLPDVTLTVSAQNVLDNDHQEFVGAPRIGRFVMARLRAEF